MLFAVEIGSLGHLLGEPDLLGPDLICHVPNELQLAPLFVDGELVALEARGKAALRG